MPLGGIGLGNKYDLGTGFTPVNMATAANTGKRLYMANVNTVDIVLVKGVGTAGEDPVITLQEHDASTGGTSQNLAVITEYFVKSEATLDNDETWTRVTQAAAATITDPGGAGTSAEEEQIVVFSVSRDQLSSGFKYISANVADVGTGAQLGTVLYIVQREDKHASAASYLAPLR